MSPVGVFVKRGLEEWLKSHFLPVQLGEKDASSLLNVPIDIIDGLRVFASEFFLPHMQWAPFNTLSSLRARSR